MREPVAIDVRRNFRRLNLAASTPENICIRNWNAACAKMPINSCFVIEQQLFIGAVRHGHNVDIFEFRPGFAPVAMRQNVVTADFAASLDFATVRHRPMKQCVEPGDPHSARRRLDVFQES